MDTYTVSFFGHRRISDPISVEKKLDSIIEHLLQANPYVEFLVGRDGDFDLMVSSSIHRCKRSIRNDNSSHIWVLPYMTADLRNNEESYLCYYDEIEIAEKCHYKSAFQARNRAMVDRSDLVVFCVSQKSGGAYQTLCYAQKQRKPIINLNDLI